jgi:hypothetical protein
MKPFPVHAVMTSGAAIFIIIPLFERMDSESEREIFYNTILHYGRPFLKTH